MPLTLPQALAGALGEAPAVPATLPLGDAVARSVPLTAALAEGGSEAVPPRALALGALAEGLALALGVCTESGVAQKTPSASQPQGEKEAEKEGVSEPLGLQVLLPVALAGRGVTEVV